MKSQWIVLFFSLASTALAQTGGPKPLPLRFSNGSIALEMHTESSDARSLFSTAGSISTAPGSDPHRVVLDQQDRVLFAYDIQMRKAGPGLVTIRIKPIDQEKIRGESWFARYRTIGEIPTLAAAREFPPLKVGDAVQVDILYHPATGERIYDVLKVASDQPPSYPAPSSTGEQFSLFKVRVDIKGKTIAEERNTWMIGGAVMVYLPGRGYFYLGLSPSSKLPLRAAGWADHNILRFLAGGELVEIVSEVNVLQKSDFATIWVYREPAPDGGSVDFWCGDTVESLVRLNKGKD